MAPSQKFRKSPGTPSSQATDADQANNPNSMVTYSIISGDVFDNFDFVQPDENQAEGDEKNRRKNGDFLKRRF